MCSFKSEGMGLKMNRGWHSSNLIQIRTSIRSSGFDMSQGRKIENRGANGSSNFTLD